MEVSALSVAVPVTDDCFRRLSSLSFLFNHSLPSSAITIRYRFFLIVTIINFVIIIIKCLLNSIIPRKRIRRTHKLTGIRRLVSKMAAADVISGNSYHNMLYRPILEDGVFRFDVSANDSEAAYPSISFVTSKDRDIPIMTDSFPTYTPTYQCLNGKQTVKLEVSFE